METPHGPDGTGGGDPIRSWRHLHEGNSLWWTVQARNKQSIALNLKHPEAREIARRLALDADVVVENYRPGVLEKWGLGYEQLRAINPALIMVRLSGYGQTGPMKDQPGFGAIGESMGGLRYVSGHPDRPPLRVGISIGDSIAALHGVIGAMMALRHRDATGGRWNGVQGEGCQAGQGQMVDVALYEAVFNMMESLVPEYDVAGVVRERTGGALPGIVPSNTYTTRDGQNIVIAGNGDAIFHRLMLAIGRDDWPRIRTGAQRRPRPPRRRDRWRHPAMVRWPRHRGGAQHPEGGRRAGRQDLQRGRHVHGSAVPGAPHDRTAPLRRRQSGQAAGGGAQARKPRAAPAGSVRH